MNAIDVRLKGNGGLLRLLCCFILLPALLLSACGTGSEGQPAGPAFLKANAFFAEGKYEAGLDLYRKAIEEEPETADRMLFEMGIIHAHPANERKSYPMALECFRKIISDYPKSKYRRDSQMLMLQIRNVIVKDNLIAQQQARLDTCRQGIESRDDEIIILRRKIEILEGKLFRLRTEPVDKILIEKAKRRLMLISKGEVIKTYKIALGGNPVGPKERQGDNKTPEGNYIIVSRNRHSDYHLSLRISYPNEKDKARARALGVSPGGDIMIHGVKKELAWVGGMQAQMDWTQGCIAVTNTEMEEIARLVPNGTPVEIRP